MVSVSPSSPPNLRPHVSSLGHQPVSPAVSQVFHESPTTYLEFCLKHPPDTPLPAQHSRLSPGGSGRVSGRAPLPQASRLDSASQDMQPSPCQSDSRLHPPPREAQTCRANLRPAEQARRVQCRRKTLCPGPGALFSSLSPCRSIFLRAISPL